MSGNFEAEQQIWDHLKPKMVTERAEQIVQFVRNWMREEFLIYGKTHNTDTVTCNTELTHCRVKFQARDGSEHPVQGYRLVLSITGNEPQHPLSEVDCFFVENDAGLINDIILSVASNGTGKSIQ